MCAIRSLYILHVTLRLSLLVSTSKIVHCHQAIDTYLCKVVFDRFSIYAFSRLRIFMQIYTFIAKEKQSKSNTSFAF